MRCSVKPYNGDKPYIFFSYCHKDEETVYPMIERMARDGYRIWYDEGIDPGADWPEVIAGKLKGSSIVMCCLSKESLKSHNCKNELNFAIEEKKNVIAVKIEKVMLSLGVRLQLSSVQRIDKMDYPDDKLYEKLYACENIYMCLGSSSDMEPNTDTAEDTKKEELEKQKQAELEKQKQEELEKQKQAELEKQKQEELEKQKQAELEKQKQEELEKKKQAELEKQKQEELEKKKQAELEKQKQEELEKQKQAELEKQKQEELERQKQAELEKQKQIELEKQKQAESESRKQIDLEKHEENDDDDTVTVMHIEDEGCTVIDTGDYDTECGHTVLEVEPAAPPVLLHLETGRFYKGNYSLTTVGRSKSKCDIVLGDFDTISSYHMDIIVYHGKNYIIDREHANGTFYEDRRLDTDKQEEVPDHAEIRLANEKFLLAFDEKAEAMIKNGMVASLRSYDTHETIYLFGGELKLGRHFKWSKGACSSDKISREHAVLSFENGAYSVTDCSANGTFINNSRERIEKHVPIKLNDNDMIRIGAEKFIYRQWVFKENEE